MLKNAIQHVIDDSSFHLKVEPAATALQQAKYVAESNILQITTTILAVRSAVTPLGDVNPCYNDLQ